MKIREALVRYAEANPEVKPWALGEAEKGLAELAKLNQSAFDVVKAIMAEAETADRIGVEVNIYLEEHPAWVEAIYRAHLAMFVYVEDMSEEAYAVTRAVMAMAETGEELSTSIIWPGLGSNF